MSDVVNTGAEAPSTTDPPSLNSAVKVDNLTVHYGAVPALLDVSFEVERGQLVGIIGPNGSGKSTLIKSVLGFVKPDFGSVQLFGKDVDQARGQVAYVPQRGTVDWDFPITVREVAMMGRYGHVPWWRDLTAADRKAADDALEMVRMSPYRNRQIGQLSGGQQQRVFLARAMAQNAEILLLDEPFAGVDAATEKAILDVLEQTKRSGRTLLVVHHDLSTAADYFDSLLLLKQRLFAHGTPELVLHPKLLAEVYEGALRVFSNLPAATSPPIHRSKGAAKGNDPAPSKGNTP